MGVVLPFPTLDDPALRLVMRVEPASGGWRVIERRGAAVRVLPDFTDRDDAAEYVEATLAFFGVGASLPIPAPSQEPCA